jgi:L-fuconolactonase
MRVDSHQHFWRYDPAAFPWIKEGMDGLRRDYMPPDLEPLLRAAGFDGAIAVQARQVVEETEFLLHLADEHAFVKGVVGWVDLCSARVADQLARYAPHPKMVGVRHIVHDEPDDDFVLRKDFREGIARLREYNLTYDLLLFPRHVPRAVRLVEEFPDQPFVLDHIAKPIMRDGLFSPWREDVQRLAAFPNVSCKLSGLVTEAHWDRWRPEDIHPYLDVVAEAFGPSRLMIGSDWPVCTLAGDYRTTMALVVDYVQRLSISERDGILGSNAARLYGLAGGMVGLLGQAQTPLRPPLRVSMS